MAKFDNLGAYAESLATQLGGFNVKQYLMSEALRVSRYANFTLHRMLGEYVGGEGRGSTPNFKRLKKVSNEVRVPLQMTLPGRMAGIARGGAAHTAAWTAAGAYADDHGGAAYVPVAEYVGRNAKGTDEVAFLDGSAGAVDMEGFWRNLVLDDAENTFGTALWATAAPAANVLGGIPYAVDDGVTSAVYMGVDRSIAANADFRSYVESTAEPLSPEKIDYVANYISTRTVPGGGAAIADTAVTGLTLFGRCQTIARSFSQGRMDAEFGKVGFKKVAIGDMVVGLDHRVPSGEFYLGDSRGCTVATNSSKGFVTLLKFDIDPTTVASYMAMYQSLIQVIFHAPYTWGKLTNKT